MTPAATPTASPILKRVPKTVGLGGILEDVLRLLEQIEQYAQRAELNRRLETEGDEADDLLVLARWVSNACRAGLSGAGLELEEAWVLRDGLTWLWLRLNPPVPDNALRIGHDLPIRARA